MLSKLEHSIKEGRVRDLEGSKGHRLWDHLDLGLNFYSATYY